MYKEGFKLKDIFKVVGIPEATYYYHMKNRNKDNPDKNLEDTISKIFIQNNGSYGYRRIGLELRNCGIIVNHKKVQRIMKKLGLKYTKFWRKSRKFNAYKGEHGKMLKT